MELVARYRAIWEASLAPRDVEQLVSTFGQLSADQTLALLLEDQQLRWTDPLEPTLLVEEYVARFPQLVGESHVMGRLLWGEITARRCNGEGVNFEQLRQRFPQLDEWLESAGQAATARQDVERSGDQLADSMLARDALETWTRGGSDSDDSDTPASSDEKNAQRGLDAPPIQLGPFQLVRRLGRGGQGEVWLAYEPQLRRQVALKLPAVELLRDPRIAEHFLREARIAASLEHRHIVPIYRVEQLASEDSQTGSDLIYVVSRFIEGDDLRRLMRQQSVPQEVAVAWMADVADALQFAHQKGLIHRDIKPANLLIERQTGDIYVADFGLAIEQSLVLEMGSSSGTPAYMSPEQMRGEGHRLDPTSDLFSLGVVFYELLTGRRPFQGLDVSTLRRQITLESPPRPRALDESIPEELERICLKLLSKNHEERYANAQALADELRTWGQVQRVNIELPPPAILPGLLPFSPAEHDFYLELLPGTRDRDGLPSRVSFWTRRLNAVEAHDSFSVGVLFGDSGSGKTSLLQAGVRPRIAPLHRVVFLSATAEQTEEDLRHAILRQCPELALSTAEEAARDSDEPSASVGLAELCGRLRRDSWAGPQEAAPKVILIIDQFERWLVTYSQRRHSELVQALRQCDGERLQAVLAVNAERAAGLSSFMSAIETPLIQGVNFSILEPFDVTHGEEVLGRLGRASLRLPGGRLEPGSPADDFVRSAVAALAQAEQVQPIELMLFVELMQGRPWEPRELKRVLPLQPLGIRAIEQRMTELARDLETRSLVPAMGDLLQALLPVSTGDEGPPKRSLEFLADYCGVPLKSNQFERLLETVTQRWGWATRVDLPGPAVGDRGAETRRAETRGAETRRDDSRTLSDPTSHESFDWPVGEPAEPASWMSEGTGLQLSHEYLVEPLRRWSKQHQRSSMGGRAELRLEERASAWSLEEDDRQLPSLSEWLAIALLTARRKWGSSQQQMMRRAGFRHLMRISFAGLLAMTLCFVAWSMYHVFRGQVVVENLLESRVSQLPAAIDDVQTEATWVLPRLRRIASRTPRDAQQRRHQLHARLALLREDPAQLRPVLEALLEGESFSYFRVILRELQPFRTEVIDECVETFRNADREPARRFRAALVLARWFPRDEAWTSTEERWLVERLVEANPVLLPELWEWLQPLREGLLPHLEAIFREQAGSTAAMNAANSLIAFVPDDDERLVRLLPYASPDQYELVFAHYQRVGGKFSKRDLFDVIRQTPTREMLPAQRLQLGRRRALAAFTLLRLGERAAVLDVLRFRDDPEGLTQFVVRCRAYGVPPEAIWECFDFVDVARGPFGPSRLKIDDTVFYGLLLALGEYPRAALESIDPDLIPRLREIHARDPSARVHSASAWLLRHWGEHAAVRQVEQTPVPFDPTLQREWYVQEVVYKTRDWAGQPRATASLHFTMIVFPWRRSLIGSVHPRPGQEVIEQLRTARNGDAIAVCDREVTRRQWQALVRSQGGELPQNRITDSQDRDLPVSDVTWGEAVEFCRWLSRQLGADENQQALYQPSSSPNPAFGWAIEHDRPAFRLLTETEWELFSRDGIQTPYALGSDRSLLDRFAWYAENSGKRSQAAASKRPSLAGLFDTHGNVGEWCFDWYSPRAPLGTDAVTSLPGPFRTVKGGSFQAAAEDCRLAHRTPAVEITSAPERGFRVAFGVGYLGWRPLGNGSSDE